MLPPGEPQVVVRLGEVGFQLHRSLITRDGQVELSLVLPGVSQVKVRLGPIGSERQSTLDALDSGLMVADLTCDEPQQVPRIVVIGVSRKNLPVNRLRLTQSAHLVMLNSDGQGLGDRGHGYRTANTGSGPRPPPNPIPGLGRREAVGFRAAVRLNQRGASLACSISLRSLTELLQTCQRLTGIGLGGDRRGGPGAGGRQDRLPGRERRIDPQPARAQVVHDRLAVFA